MEAARRHAVTWSFVAAAHLVAAAVAVGGAVSSRIEPVREGGLLLVVSVAEPEPIAPAGEAPAGTEAGAGASTSPATESVAAVAPPVETVVTVPSFAPAPAVSSAPAAAVAAPAPAAVAPRVPVLEPPTFLVREEPAYPPRARRAGSEGRVVVKVQLSASGEVVALVVQESSGSDLLDQAALAAARASRFSPARRDGAAEPSEALAAYRFELR